MIQVYTNFTAVFYRTCEAESADSRDPSADKVSLHNGLRYRSVKPIFYRPALPEVQVLLKIHPKPVTKPQYDTHSAPEVNVENL